MAVISNLHSHWVHTAPGRPADLEGPQASPDILPGKLSSSVLTGFQTATVEQDIQPTCRLELAHYEKSS